MYMKCRIIPFIIIGKRFAMMYKQPKKVILWKYFVIQILKYVFKIIDTKFYLRSFNNLIFWYWIKIFHKIEKPEINDEKLRLSNFYFDIILMAPWKNSILRQLAHVKKYISVLEHVNQVAHFRSEFYKVAHFKHILKKYFWKVAHLKEKSFLQNSTFRKIFWQVCYCTKKNFLLLCKIFFFDEMC